MAYGLSYIGSKNLIARELLQQMARREWFVDLFAGGGAMWHAAAESGKYSRFIVNEYNALQLDFLRDCAAGIYNERNGWVSSTDFRRDISKSKFLQCVWSFGGTDDGYFCSSVSEEWEEALFHAYKFGDYSLFKNIGFDGVNVYLDDIKLRTDFYKHKYMEYKFGDLDRVENRISIRHIKEQNDDIKKRFSDMLRAAANSHGLTGAAIDYYLGNNMWSHYTARPLGRFAFPTRENYERMREIMPTLPICEETEIELLNDKEKDFIILKEKREWHVSSPYRRLQRLRAFHKKCERLDIVRKTDFHAKSYEEIEIPENALIYCDPPYINTKGYGVDFDHARFYDWCREQKELVLISEYTMPEDFIPIWRKNKCVCLCGGGTKKAEEKLFIHKSQIPLLYKRNGGYQTKLWL